MFAWSFSSACLICRVNITLELPLIFSGLGLFESKKIACLRARNQANFLKFGFSPLDLDDFEARFKDGQIAVVWFLVFGFRLVKPLTLSES